MKVLVRLGARSVRAAVAMASVSLSLLAGAETTGLPVVTIAVTEQDWNEHTDVQGTIIARDAIRVSAPVGDLVTRILFTEGQQVEQGAVLVELARQAEEAALALAQARLREAELALKRARSLSRQSAVSEAALDEAEVQVAVAKANVRTAQAAIDERIIRAPFAGRIGLRDVSPGAFVAAGAPITTLYATEGLRVEFALPQSHLHLAQPESRLRVRESGLGATEWSARLEAAEGRLDGQTRSMRWRALMEGYDERLAPGLAVQVRVEGPPRKALTLPEAALLPRGGEHFVYRVVDQRAEYVPVQIGARRRGSVEIRSGLERADQVVLRGGDRLRPGMRVQSQPTSAPLAPVPGQD